MFDKVAQEFLLLEALEILLEKIELGYELSHGVCHNVDMILQYVFDTPRIVESHLFFHEHWVNWPKYSGNSSFPIPGRYDEKDNWIGDKRELRLDLVQFLISSYEENLLL